MRLKFIYQVVEKLLFCHLKLGSGAHGILILLDAEISSA